MYSRRKFILTSGIGVAGMSLFPYLNACLSKQSEPISLSHTLPRSTPELQGVDSKGILNFLNAVEKSDIEFHSLMIIRHGHVVAEGWWSPYHPSYKHTLYSLSKSFTSTAIGFAVDEKLLAVEDPVISFFPDKMPEEISPMLRDMKVKHLLTMSIGHPGDTFGEMKKADSDWVQVFFDQPILDEPGTKFFYNSGATYMLSAIIKEKTGQTLMEYLQPRLFDPLEMKGMDWEESPDGVNKGATGLRCKTEGIAKLGLLYLQKGKWNGEQIISESWVNDATSKQINSGSNDPNDPKDNDWAHGYGYKFWRNRPEGYRADGAFGQYSIVLPGKDAVVAITEETTDMQATMNLVWDYLLPAMKNTGSITGNINAQSKLNSALQGLSITPPFVSSSSPIAKDIACKMYVLNENPMSVKNVMFHFNDTECIFDMEDDYGMHQIKCNFNGWNDDNYKSEPNSLFPFVGKTNIDSKIAASVTWLDDQTLQMTWRLVQTAHYDTITCRFEGDKINISFLNSVAEKKPSEPDYRKDIKGKVI